MWLLFQPFLGYPRFSPCHSFQNKVALAVRRSFIAWTKFYTLSCTPVSISYSFSLFQAVLPLLCGQYSHLGTRAVLSPHPLLKPTTSTALFPDFVTSHLDHCSLSVHSSAQHRPHVILCPHRGPNNLLKIWIGASYSYVLNRPGPLDSVIPLLTFSFPSMLFSLPPPSVAPCDVTLGT